MANSASSNELHSITKHNNIVISGVGANEVLKFDGSNWINQTLAESGIAALSGAAFTGAITGVTALTVDNLNIDGNTIISTDSNGSITFTPNGSGSVVISKVDINAGDITGVTISGGLTWSAAQNLNSQALTNVNIDSGDISAGTVSGSLTWSAAQTFGAVTATQVDITAAGDLRLQDSTGGQYVALEAAGTTTSHTLTLPATQGSASTFLQNNGSGALTWAAAGGAFTFEGGNTTEAQETGFSAADLIAVSSISIAADAPIDVTFVGRRNASGAAARPIAGFKINSTTVQEAAVAHASNSIYDFQNATYAADGGGSILLLPRLTNYTQGIISHQINSGNATGDNTSGGQCIRPTWDSNMPVATVTSITFRVLNVDTSDPDADPSMDSMFVLSRAIA